jgi:hypothetical protein
MRALQREVEISGLEHSLLELLRIRASRVDALFSDGLAVPRSPAGPI